MTPDAAAQAVTTQAVRGIRTPVRVGERAWLAVIPLAAAILFLRRPETLLRPEFFADDGHFYQDALSYGAQTITWPYAGYLAVLQRAAVAVEAAIPPLLAPLLGNLVATLALAMVAAFLASTRMSRLFPSPWVRAGLGLLLVLLPAADPLQGTLSHLQWMLGVYLVALLVATPPTSTRGRFADGVSVLLCGLTGPIGAVLLPLYAVRAWKEPPFRWHLIWLGLASMVQFAVYLAAERSRGLLEPALFPQVLAYRALVVPFLGEYGPAFSWVLAGAVLIALVLAVSRLPRSLVIGAGIVVGAFALAGLLSTQAPRDTASLLDRQNGVRYFYLGQVAVVGLLVLALTRREWRALPAVLLLAAGIAADFRIPPVPAAGWAERAACIRGPIACSVPVSPLDLDWTVRWEPT